MPRRLSDSACVLRRIPRLQGGAETSLTAMAELASVTTRQAWARPPIDVDFQVLMFTASGLLVRFLKVFEKSNYSSVKWVRYLTKASGTYQIRVSAHDVSSWPEGLIDRCFSCSFEARLGLGVTSSMDIHMYAGIKSYGS